MKTHLTGAVASMTLCRKPVGPLLLAASEEEATCKVCRLTAKANRERVPKVPKTHLPGEPGFTLCGRSISDFQYNSHELSRDAERSSPLSVIGPNDLIDSATCKACQNVDDVRQVREHRQSCARAGIDPDTGEKL